MKRLFPIVILAVSILISGCAGPDKKKEEGVSRTEKPSSEAEKSTDPSPPSVRPQQTEENDVDPVLVLHKNQSVGNAEQQVKKFGGKWTEGRAYAMKGGFDPSRYRTFRVPYGPSGYLTLTPDLLKVEQICYQPYPPKLKGNANWHLTERLRWESVSFIEEGERVRDVKTKVILAGGTWRDRPEFGTSVGKNPCSNASELSGFTIREIRAGHLRMTRGVKLCESTAGRDNTKIVTRIETCSRMNLPERHREWHATNVLPVADYWFGRKVLVGGTLKN